VGFSREVGLKTKKKEGGGGEKEGKERLILINKQVFHKEDTT
jgi:hypothetical protein